ncbi:MAG: hypothetical protein H6838_08225 [Planctomycetes bacterium]|nr:hypothetical protein [Planctomycetota bacterium]MCB9885464.1 hypothetical protein [Planctomycetota bacterium]
MNLALTYCYKEWHAQRGTLLAYTLLVFACLGIGLSITPAHYWPEEGDGVLALSWFVAVGVIGVVAFVAPALVRAEFHHAGDQFVRRLPGALGPSFAGKLLFLALATLALPLLGLAVGEVFVKLNGHGWDDLFRWDWTGEVTVAPLLVPTLCGAALLLVPWVWAIATWMPSARMALGGTALFVLLLGLGAFAVLRLCPNLGPTLEWSSWLWLVAPLGLLVAAVSWCARRGGGALRSARRGLAAAAIGLLPPSAWLAQEAWVYHHPDLQQLHNLTVLAVSTDGTRALARGAARYDFSPVSLAIDLRTGEAQQLTGIDTYLTNDYPRGFWNGRQARFWLAYERSSEQLSRCYDLDTGSWRPLSFDPRSGDPVLPPELRADARDAVRSHSPLHSAEGRLVWLEGRDLCRQEEDGSVVRQSLPVRRVGFPSYPIGHGIRIVFQNDYYDFRGRLVLSGEGTSVWVVGDRLLFLPPKGPKGEWQQKVFGGEAEPCAALAGCKVFGLFDDTRVLCARFRHGQWTHLFLYRPADGHIDELRVPDGVQSQLLTHESPCRREGSLLARDPAGGLWLCAHAKDGETFLRIDTASLEVTRVLEHRRGDGSYYRLLGWPDAHHVLVSQDQRILRLHLATGERSVLFPKELR